MRHLATAVGGLSYVVAASQGCLGLALADWAEVVSGNRYEQEVARLATGVQAAGCRQNNRVMDFAQKVMRHAGSGVLLNARSPVGTPTEADIMVDGRPGQGIRLVANDLEVVFRGWQAVVEVGPRAAITIGLR